MSEMTLNVELTRTEVAALATALRTYKKIFVAMGKSVTDDDADANGELTMFDHMLMDLEILDNKFERLLIVAAESFVSDLAERGINISKEDLVSNDIDTETLMSNILSQLEENE